MAALISVIDTMPPSVTLIGHTFAFLFECYNRKTELNSIHFFIFFLWIRFSESSPGETTNKS